MSNIKQLEKELNIINNLINDINNKLKSETDYDKNMILKVELKQINK